MMRNRLVPLRATPVLMAAAMLAVLAGAVHVQTSALAGYPNDSFWDLGAFGRVGVLLISAVGLTLIFLFLAWKSRFFRRLRRLPWGLGLALDLVAGLLIYAVLFSMSPQAYYALYQLVFPDLPSQIVVRHILSPRLFDIVGLRLGGSMSDHLAGIALWAILPFTFWLHSHGPKA